MLIWKTAPGGAERLTEMVECFLPTLPGEWEWKNTFCPEISNGTCDISQWREGEVEMEFVTVDSGHYGSRERVSFTIPHWVSEALETAYKAWKALEGSPVITKVGY